MKHHPSFSRFLRLTLMLFLAALLLGNPQAAGSSKPASGAAVSSGGAIVRISVASDGTQANNNSFLIDTSLDGRYVLFSSHASNLVAGDTNNLLDTFLRDRYTGQTTRITTASVNIAADGTPYSGGAGFDLSPDGRYVVYTAYVSPDAPVEARGALPYVYDRQTGQASLALSWFSAESPFDMIRPMISPDGHYVAFSSTNGGLIGQDIDANGTCDLNCDTNGLADVFLYDRQTGQMRRLSAPPGGETDYDTWLRDFSEDGRWLAFQSLASNLTPGDIRDPWNWDMFFYDLQTGQISMASVNSDEQRGNDAHHSVWGKLNGNGQRMVFESWATNLDGVDTNGFRDIFLRDRATGETHRVSTAAYGGEPNGESYVPDISADGRYALFFSTASNLIGTDLNGDGICDQNCDTTASGENLFVTDLQQHTTRLISLIPNDALSIVQTGLPLISDQGQMAFVTVRAKLVAEDTNDFYDVYMVNLGLLVNSTADRPDADLADGVCDTGQDILRDGTPEPECTLRAAIQQANASQFNTITFDVPNVTGAPVLAPTSVLPDITTPLTLDASTQPGVGRVILDGASAGTGISGLIVDADDVFIYGLTVQHFGWNGIYFDTPEDRLLTLGAVTLSDNCQWGLAAAGSVDFTNWQDQPNRIERNGSGDSCQAGGVLMWGDPDLTTLDGFGLQVNNNDGPGLFVTGNIELTGRSDAPLRVTGNNGDGIFSLYRQVTLVTVDGEHEVSGNRGRGIAAHGICGEDLDGGIILEGIVLGVKLLVNDNAGWGLAGCMVGHPAGDYRGNTLLTAHNNGHGPTCQYWDWGTDGNLRGTPMECWGGGVLAYQEDVSISGATITANGGPGILAKNGAEIWGGLTGPVNISDNQGDGIFTRLGSVWFALGEGSHQVNGNQGRGIVSMGSTLEDGTLGGIQLEGGTLDVRDNAGWGLVGTEVGVPNPYTYLNIANNGHGPTCWEAGVIRFNQSFPFVHQRNSYASCRGGGVLAYRGDVHLRGAQIQDNGGPGILARGAVYLVNGSTRPLQITGNQGTGVQSESGHVELELIGSSHQIASNQGDGIATEGLWVGITGNLDIRRNAGRGIYSYGAVSAGWLDGSAIDIWKVTIYQNGANGKCFTWKIRSTWGMYAETPCPSGGIRADHGEARLSRVEVDNNWGNGIFARGDVIVHNGLVISNGGYGIQLRGVLTQIASEISSNSLGAINHLPPSEEPGDLRFAEHASGTTPSVIRYSQIHSNNGDGVRFEGGTGLNVEQTNLWDNTGLGVNNLPAALSLTAAHNWWGDATGPAGPNGDGVSAGVETSSWLIQPVGLVAYPAADPVYAPPGQPVTATVFIQNWATVSDTVTVAWSDTQGWITPTTPVTLSLNALGMPAFISLTIPPGAALGALDVVTATVVSVADPAASVVASFQVSAAPVADLRLSIASPEDISTPYTYTLQVANAGPSAAADTNVTITLPDGAGLLSATATQGDCTGSVTLLCSLGALESGSAVTLTVRVQLAVGPGPLNAQAEVTASTFDPHPYNNADLTWVEAQYIYLPLVQYLRQNPELQFHPPHLVVEPHS